MWYSLYRRFQALLQQKIFSAPAVPSILLQYSISATITAHFSSIQLSVIYF